MICYELPNGKSIHISLDKLLNMTDADIHAYIADNQGYTSNNPFRKLPYGEDDNDQLSFDRETEDDDDNEYYQEDTSLDILNDGDDVDFDYDPDNL